jgi:hypothetical protein
VNAAPGAAFTTLHFLRKLQIFPISEIVFSLACLSSKCVTILQLTGPFESNKENEVL